MSRRAIIAACLAGLVGPILFWLLMRATGIGPAEIGRLFRGLKVLPAVVVAIATGLCVVVAGEKWRLVETHLSGAAPTRRQAITLSAVGSALGQFLPPPIASAVARGGGNRLNTGGGARRGALGSVWEQLFDFGAIAILLVPAAVSIATRNPIVFVVGAPLIALIVDAAIAPMAKLAARLAPFAAQLLDPALCRALYRWSLVRFALLTIMTLGVALAIGSAIPLAPLAAAIPTVAAAAVGSFLPGGLGVNEWSFVLILGLWAIPAAQVAAFALMNRLLVACFSLAYGLAAAMLVERPGPRRVAVKAFAR